MKRPALGFVLALSLLAALAPSTLASVAPAADGGRAVQGLVAGSNSCTGTFACVGATGPIGDNSCNGDFACEDTGYPIGNGSCNGLSACDGTQVMVGNYSCNGDSVCDQALSAVGDCALNDYAPAECVQPDGMVRRSGGPRYGNDIYNTDAAGQEVDGGPRSYRQGAVRWFYVYFQNDGQVSDSFTVMGCEQDMYLRSVSDPGYTVTFYRPSGADITAAVEAGTFTTPTLSPGERYAIRARVQIGPGAAHGSEVYRLFTITSVGNGAKQDAVRFEIARR